jgi:voltage-gated potassium channel
MTTQVEPGAAPLGTVNRHAASTFDRFTRIVEWPMAVLALAVVPALILEVRAESSAVVRAAIVVNWMIWIGFCAEYVTKLALAPQRAAYLRAAWFDLVIIVLSPPFLVPETFQGLRAIRIARVVRLMRLLRALAVASMGLRLLRRLLHHRRFGYVLAVALAILGFGAVGIYIVEGGTNPAVDSIGDALWWAVVTVTTVGYGDVSPVTVEGRVIAVLLMITGIGIIGVFTATVASFFFEQNSAETVALEARLVSLERKVDQLLAQTAVRSSDHRESRRP